MVALMPKTRNDADSKNAVQVEHYFISTMNFSEDLVFLREIECFVGMVHWFASISARISCEEWQDQSLLP